MGKLIMCVGLPASGKTTWAKKQQDAAGAVRVNRDDLRAMLHAGYPWSKARERVTVAVRNKAIVEALAAGCLVISDDTNLDPFVQNELGALAVQVNVPFEVKDFTDVPLEVCLERNLARPNPVPPDVIHRMHAKYLDKARQKGYTPVVRAHDHTLPDAILCDLDGTLAHLNGRNPYDASTCEADTVNDAVLRALTGSIFVDGKRPVTVIFMSGRMEKDRAPTEAWLKRYVLPFIRDYRLHMRATDDTRKDSIVKRELFDAHVEGKFNVLLAFDDRNQVVALWRSLGIPTFQVAAGDF